MSDRTVLGLVQAPMLLGSGPVHHGHGEGDKNSAERYDQEPQRPLFFKHLRGAAQLTGLARLS
jgi:hypothetical protein